MCKRKLLLTIFLTSFAPTRIAFAGEDAHHTIDCFAQISGHPIHPMFVVFPLALLITSLLFDLIYFKTHDNFWQRSSFYLMLIGVLGGLAAAAPGMLDFLLAIPKSSESHQTAAIHGILNGVVILLFGLNLYLRRKRSFNFQRFPKGVFNLSIVGVVILFISAELGGHMVYNEGVGVMLEKHEEGGHIQMDKTNLIYLKKVSITLINR